MSEAAIFRVVAVAYLGGMSLTAVLWATRSLTDRLLGYGPMLLWLWPVSLPVSVIVLLVRRRRARGALPRAWVTRIGSARP